MAKSGRDQMFFAPKQDNSGASVSEQVYRECKNQIEVMLKEVARLALRLHALDAGQENAPVEVQRGVAYMESLVPMIELSRSAIYQDLVLSEEPADILSEPSSDANLARTSRLFDSGALSKGNESVGAPSVPGAKMGG